MGQLRGHGKRKRDESVSANWVDLILIVVVVAAVAIEGKRGFGRAFFDFAALVLALKLVSVLHGSVSASFRFAADAATNQAVLYGVLFLLIGSGCWFVGKQIYDHTLLTLETFDPVLGAVLGVAVAVVLGHAFTQMLATIGTVDGNLPLTLTKSGFGMEFYDFKSYHSFVTFVCSLTS